MAPGQILTTTLAATIGVKAAKPARALAAGFGISDDTMQTVTVAGVGIAVAAAGVAIHRRNDGAGYAGPALIGFGGGMALGAVADHFGWE